MIEYETAETVKEESDMIDLTVRESEEKKLGLYQGKS